MEPEGLIRLFVLSFSAGLTLWLIERLILPRLAKAQDTPTADPSPPSDDPGLEPHS